MIKNIKFLMMLTIFISFNSYSSSVIPCINAQHCGDPKLSEECNIEGEPLNLTDAKECVQHYFECGQYDRDLDNVVEQTIAYLENIPAVNNATIVWDLDDTIFQAYYCEQKFISFGYIPELWHEWILRGNAKVLPQAKRLFDYAKMRGFKNIIITGRKSHEYDISAQNLQNEGIEFDELIVRSPEETKMSASKFKFNHRKQLVEENNIEWMATIGDQWSDHALGYTDFKVKFPNPGYRID
jgi:predicted secreted acid phosphatase